MKLALAAACLAACSFSQADFRGTEYQCGPGGACPAGFRCADGACIAHDADTNTDAPPADSATPACAGNLVANPSFETGTSGWGGVGGPLTQIDDGHAGSRAAEKCADGSQAYYNVNDNPDSVPNTAPGETYHLRAWLRSSSGQNLNAVIRAKNGIGDSVEQSTSSFLLKTDWQEVTVSHTVEDPSSASVEIYFSVSEFDVGSCFQLDDICLLPDS